MGRKDAQIFDMEDEKMKAVDFIEFFADKKEHYPISDEFIENYRQKKGDSYIDFAEKTGHSVCSVKHEPNQKWHLLESYFIRTLIEKKDNMDFQIKGFKCPELLLWLAEAADVDEDIVKQASDYAKEKIDEIRKNQPEKSYSADAVVFMNKKLKEKKGKNLWSYIIENVGG